MKREWRGYEEAKSRADRIINGMPPGGSPELPEALKALREMIDSVKREFDAEEATQPRSSRR